MNLLLLLLLTVVGCGVKWSGVGDPLLEGGLSTGSHRHGNIIIILAQRVLVSFTSPVSLAPSIFVNTVAVQYNVEKLPGASGVEHVLANAGHAGLYVFMTVMPATGILMGYYGGTKRWIEIMDEEDGTNTRSGVTPTVMG
jgi:hypothetical protein